MVSSTTVMGFEWTFMVLAYVLVGARIFVRLQMRRDSLYWSDYWLVVALASAQGLLICDTLTYRDNAMDNFTVTSVSLDKIRFATGYFFGVGMYFPKFSIIAFYYNLVPPTNLHIRVALYILTAITGISGLVTFTITTFWCGPNPAINWSKDEDSCSVFESMTFMRLNWSLNFLTEVLNFAFPLPLVGAVKFCSSRERIILTIIFTMGLITIAVSIGRFVMMLYISNDITIYIWATAELCISIMIVALTALRPLLRKIGHMISSNLVSDDTKPCQRICSSEQQKETKASSACPVLESFWRNSWYTYQSQVAGAHMEPTTSQGEFNDLEKRGTQRTEEGEIPSEAVRNTNTDNYSNV